jgi:hypothetical protein
MKTRDYKTLRGLTKHVHQYSLDDFVKGMAYHDKLGWIKIRLSDELRDELVKGFADAIDLRKAYRLETLYESCGILKRLFYDGRRFTYCAGQDYPGEVRFIKDWIRKHC